MKQIEGMQSAGGAFRSRRDLGWEWTRAGDFMLCPEGPLVMVMFNSQPGEEQFQAKGMVHKGPFLERLQGAQCSCSFS